MGIYGNNFVEIRNKFDNLQPILNSEDNVTGNPDHLSDHGLFSAGIVYGIVPHVEIHLIEVLNQNCVGDFLALLWGLAKIQEFLAADTSYNNAFIVNCSFMFRHALFQHHDDIPAYLPGHLPVKATVNATWKFFRRYFENLRTLPGDPSSSTKGIICCASGNNYHESTSQQKVSQNTDGNIEVYPVDAEPMAPASFESTYGIGALCIENGAIKPATYSRVPDAEGYWALGGGEDYGPKIIVSSEEEKSRSLLSIIISAASPDDPDWIRGIGTSFSTAVASGIFAVYSLTETNVEQVKININNHCSSWDMASQDDDDPRIDSNQKILHLLQRSTISDIFNDSTPPGILIPASSP